MTFDQIVFILSSDVYVNGILKSSISQGLRTSWSGCQSPEDNHANGLLTSFSPVCPHSIRICDISQPMCSHTSTVPLIPPHRTETVCLPRLWLARRGTLGSGRARFWEMSTAIEIQMFWKFKRMLLRFFYAWRYRIPNLAEWGMLWLAVAPRAQCRRFMHSCWCSWEVAGALQGWLMVEGSQIIGIMSLKGIIGNW